MEESVKIGIENMRKTILSLYSACAEEIERIKEGQAEQDKNSKD